PRARDRRRSPRGLRESHGGRLHLGTGAHRQRPPPRRLVGLPRRRLRRRLPRGAAGAQGVAPVNLYDQGLLDTPFGWTVALLVGLAFGFWLERAGFGSSRKLAGIFYFRDSAVVQVMFTGL